MRFQEPSADVACKREFDVLVNGKTRLKSFDVFAAAGGKLKGVDWSFDLRARDGVIFIAFRPSKGKALVSALSITSLVRPAQ